MSSQNILSVVENFIACYAHLYVDFIDAADLRKGLRDYVHFKRYNSEFCDVLPKILCDCLDMNLIIVCKIGRNVFIPVCLENDKSIKPPYPLATNVHLKGTNGILLRANEHYDAIVPIFKHQPPVLEIQTDITPGLRKPNLVRNDTHQGENGLETAPTHANTS